MDQGESFVTLVSSSLSQTGGIWFGSFSEESDGKEVRGIVIARLPRGMRWREIESYLCLGLDRKCILSLSTFPDLDEGTWCTWEREILCKGERLFGNLGRACTEVESQGVYIRDMGTRDK
jgi:hypothetical protein